MTIRCKCEHCGVSLKVKDELAGKQKRCPQCQEMISIPGPAQKESAKEAGRPSQGGTGRGGAGKGGAGAEEDFPYFDDIPVKPIPGSGEFSSPLSGGGPRDYEPFDAPPRTPENKVTGSAAGIAGDLLRKIESSDRKSRGSGAANKKKRRIFGDVEGDMTTSEVSTKESLMMMVQGFLLPMIGLSALVFGAYYASDYFMGSKLKLPPLGRVTGSIKIDGQPVRNARIEFYPAETLSPSGGGKNYATSMAISDGNGNFEVYYGANIPGAVVGKHTIMISAQDQHGREMVPPTWNSASTQMYEVKSGSNKVTFEIQTDGLGGPPDPGVDPSVQGGTDPAAAGIPQAQ